MSIRKIRERIVSLVLAGLLALALMPIPAWAENVSSGSGGIPAPEMPPPP